MIEGLAKEYSGGEQLVEVTAKFFSALAERKLRMVATFAGTLSADLPRLPMSPLQQLADAKTHLETRHAAHLANQDPEARKVLEKRRNALQGQRTLHENLEALLQRRANLDTRSRLASCRSACATESISRMNGKLRKQYLTKDFQDRLFSEIKDLDLGHLRFKVQEKSDRGASFMGVALETAMKVKNREILSDGEFRALALACFLTEVNSITGHSGIIVDDPVSSLDHLRTRVVAQRLVKEATKRQVVIFTHDLVFCHELYDAAMEQNVPVVKHWIRRSEEQGFGTISQNEDPWQAKKVGPRLSSLLEKVAKLKKLTSTASESYRAVIKDLYSDLRETWERLVEELLFNGVVTRLQLGVNTQSIAGVEVTDEDHKRVFIAMKRASTFSGHDRAQATQASAPQIDDVIKDIENLKAYVDELNARRKRLQDHRKDLQKPSVGKTA